MLINRTDNPQIFLKHVQVGAVQVLNNEFMLKIFLSGGTHGDWREPIKTQLVGVEFFDPRSLKGHDMKTIARIEREWLDTCDCIFFYFEQTNPSGVGSAFEIGYCIAKGIPALYVDEKRTSHTEWLGYHCDAVFHNLDEGILALKKLVQTLQKRKHNERRTTVS